ncbi:PRC-barrel domain-containing protein [Candidatus Pacearchaeota archaeon]|nr:PRC-barrel domain-containing protein [Candidatus Pacearchaeota archaeon]
MTLKKKIVFLIFILIFAQGVFATIAESENYSVARFGTGVQASNFSSTNLEARSVLLANAGTRAAGNSLLTTNVGFWGNTTYHVIVSLSSYSTSPSSATVGSTISLSISALNSQAVWAKIISPNAMEQTLTLTNGGSVTYLPSPSVVGRYNVTFYANSSSGAIASAVSYFELTAAPSTTPAPSGGGGGGGGTTKIIEKSCTYNWDCTPWSVCSEGKQRRECKNIGTCSGTESKPIEEMPCSEALFDIAVKLKNIKLNGNKSLIIEVELKEKKSIEKIDVHIKHSIIDSENNEIFSQIETKAIIGELSYQKEINEVKLADEEYTLRVDVLYGNLQRAFAEQRFTVEKGEIETEKEYKIIPIILIFLVLMIMILVLVVLIYRRKIKESLRKIKVRQAAVVFGFVVILSLILMRGRLVGFAVDGANAVKNSWIVWIILIILVLGLFIFIYRRKIKEIAGKIQSEKSYPQNNVNGVLNKQVYTEGGQYLGRVRSIVLGKNGIQRLKVKFGAGIESKENIVDYQDVKNVGRQVIIVEKEEKGFG